MASTTRTTDRELEQLLNREASAFNRELEVERILSSFKLNPYEVLQLPHTATAEDIKKKYRNLSLFIHPDKTPHPRASDAFDILKKAESELSDKDKRATLDDVVKQARLEVIKAAGVPSFAADDHPKLVDLQPPLQARIALKSKEMLIDEEVRRRKAIKMNLANEGLEQRMKEEEENKKKRKAEDDKVWEENRETRVGNWRNFSNTSGTKKKKKSKPSLLG